MSTYHDLREDFEHLNKELSKLHLKMDTILTTLQEVAKAPNSPVDDPKLQEAPLLLNVPPEAPELDYAVISLPSQLNSDSKGLIRDFANALALKMRAAEEKYGYENGWKSVHWTDECREHLREHLEKGDPRDVAIYAAFLWYHNESTR